MPVATPRAAVRRPAPSTTTTTTHRTEAADPTRTEQLLLVFAFNTRHSTSFTSLAEIGALHGLPYRRNDRFGWLADMRRLVLAASPAFTDGSGASGRYRPDVRRIPPRRSR